MNSKINLKNISKIKPGQIYFDKNYPSYFTVVIVTSKFIRIKYEQGTSSTILKFYATDWFDHKKLYTDIFVDV